LPGHGDRRRGKNFATGPDPSMPLLIVMKRRAIGVVGHTDGKPERHWWGTNGCTTANLVGDGDQRSHIRVHGPVKLERDLIAGCRRHRVGDAGEASLHRSW